MLHFLAKKYKYIYAILIFAISVLPTASLYAAELTSSSYIIDGSFGNGNEMNSASYSVSGLVAQPTMGSYSTNSIPLAAGTITSCGKISNSGTYTLGQNLVGIAGTCFTVLADDVTIDGNGYTITAATGNNSYAVTANSVTAGGSGYNNLTLENITFDNFGGGVNANGTNGTIGGNGGSVTVTNSYLGSVVAKGGTSSSGKGGAGGSISITGTDMHFGGKIISVNGGSGYSTGDVGSVYVQGSMIVSNGEVWTADDSTWTGTRTWSFTGNGYNTGTTTGFATFADTSYNGGTVIGDEQLLAYTASSNTVVVDGNSNFLGTGKVTGSVLDSLGATITTWNLVNGSVLTGTVTGELVVNDTSYTSIASKVFGNAIFNNSAYNLGTISGDTTINDTAYNAGALQSVTFTAASFNSGNGIPNGDPTGISSGHTVAGTITFSADVPVVFNVNTSSTWNANTTSWIFNTPGQNWIFNSAVNTGTIVGNAVFNNSQNNGTVTGNSTFNTGSNNHGITTNATFYNNSYNIGTADYASFYNTTKNSSGLNFGRVNMQCDFYDSALPGIGICPAGATYYHIPYYFNNASSTSWDSLGNWWFDASSTQHAPSLPKNGDTVYIGASLTNGPSTHVTLGNIYIASSTTGGGSFSVQLTNASGPAYFYNGSTNIGVVDGVFHIFGNRGLTQVNTSGSYTGDVAFHDNSYNDTTLVHGASFYDTSYNASNGVVSGDAQFYGNNRNDGTIIGVATVNIGATLRGNGTVQNSVLNSGNLEGGVFNSLVTNFAGAVTGAVTNLVKMVFNGGSFVSSSGQLSGNAEFYATSSNRGNILGFSIFNDYAYNIGTTTDATFVGDFAENTLGNLIGTITGTRTRLFTALAPQVNLLRSFIDGPWTIVADNTVVKLLYSNLIDIFGRNPNTTTTLVERNGGVIVRPLLPSSPVTSCGILDVASSTYTLGSNINVDKLDSCFTIRANNITLDGAGYTVTASSSATSLYAIISTSTPSLDNTPNGFTNITVKNIKFVNFAHGLLGRGADVPNGKGGDGTTVAFDHVTIGDIDVSGGDPIDQGGNGGDVTVETSVTTRIKSLGGNSTACGVGGNGGNISITTDSQYEEYINDGGSVSGCSDHQTHAIGTKGTVNTSVISAATRLALAQAQSNQQARVMGVSTKDINDGNVMPLLPSINLLSPINFVSIPMFGDENSKNGFSFKDLLDGFLNGPIPFEVVQAFKSSPNLLTTLGINSSHDITDLLHKPIKAPQQTEVPGIYTFFTVKDAKATPVNSYVVYNPKTYLEQVVTVDPKTMLKIHLVPTSDSKKAIFREKEVEFVNNELTVTVPATPGRYEFTTFASPMPLVIQVADPHGITQYVDASTNFFVLIMNWIIHLFKTIFPF